jgi:hypothetical protein
MSLYFDYLIFEKNRASKLAHFDLGFSTVPSACGVHHMVHSYGGGVGKKRELHLKSA